jgi:phosphoenolpyruvate synthase/pyruvate phosphate dikinase
MMIVSLTTSNDQESVNGENIVSLVGGKAASLQKMYSTPGLTSHVPKGFALSVEFFQAVGVVGARQP